MEYTLDREVLPVGEVIFDGCQEQPVDLNVSLPDYCADIQRILKCQIYPKVSSGSVSGDRLMVDGSYTVKIFYLDPAAACVRYCDSNNTFSAEIALKQSADSAQVFAFPRVEYINCRATSPRRLDIHGAFSVCAKVLVQGQNEITGNIQGDDMEQRKKTVSVNKLAGFSQQQFSVDEVLELGPGKPPADSILRTDAFAVLQDFKVTMGKLMVKGEVCVKFLYESTEENGEPEVMEFTVPFSQVLDCDGVTEDCLCNVKIAVLGVEAQIKDDYSGDKSYFDTQIRLFASVSAYRGADITLLTDAYSRKYDLNIDSKQKSFDNLQELTGDTYVHKASLAVEDAQIVKVIDIWSEMASVSAQAADGQMQFKGKYSLCVLAVNAENKPFYFERLIDFEYSRPCGSAGGDLKCSADANVGGISYRIVGNGIEVKTELRLTAEVYCRISYPAISGVSADETKPAAEDDSAALCIYFAEEGENLWSIAREYRTSVESIRAENGIAGEQVESRGMILIPM